MQSAWLMRLNEQQLFVYLEYFNVIAFADTIMRSHVPLYLAQ